jgi:hypothetical protein
MKWILIAVAVVLAFGGGAWRTRRLLSALKRLPQEFADGKARAEDPVGHARDVTPRDTSTTSGPPR